MYGFYKSKMCLRTASLQNITVNLDLEEAEEIKKLPSLSSSNDDFVGWQALCRHAECIMVIWRA